MREHVQWGGASIALGASTVLVQLFIGAIMIVAGIVLLSAIIANLAEIIDKVGGG